MNEDDDSRLWALIWELLSSNADGEHSCDKACKGEEFHDLLTYVEWEKVWMRVPTAAIVALSSVSSM